MEENELMNTMQNVKDRFLSNIRFPKLVIGTGLSITYGIQGMQSLTNYLNQQIPLIVDSQELIKWEQISERMKTQSLEDALSILDLQNDCNLINSISVLTSRLLIETLKEKTHEIESRDSGFKRLLKYLSNTCSSNQRIIDIMTPNYDVVIEIVSDSLGLQCIDGFEGSIINQFNEAVLDIPKIKYKVNGDFCYVRLFKPHGSINWIKKENRFVKINDYRYLRENENKICIVTPGGGKYQKGLEEKCYRIPREYFSKALDQNKNTPLIVYGYGFNDSHFNSIIMEPLNRPLLVVSKTIPPHIIEKLIHNTENVVFYEKDGSNKIIYKSIEYETKYDFWNLDTLANLLIA